MMLKALPCLKPWDTLIHERFCVFRNGTVLTALADAGRLGYVALGTPCQSQS